jgi:hypothetical protein
MKLQDIAARIKGVVTVPAPRKDLRALPAVWRVVCCILILHLSFPGGMWAQKPAARALGSIQATGEIYLNGMRAAGEQTLFAGDTVRTGADGVAALTLPGVGILNMGPQTEISFGTGRYLATLKQGTIGVRSFQSVENLDIQFGKIVMYLPSFEPEAAGTVTVGADGTALVECRAGSVGLTAIEGTEAVSLHPGESEEISADGKFRKVEAVAPPAPASTGQAPAPPQAAGKRRSRSGYIILGVVVAGGGVGAALALSHKASGQAVSTSVP